MHRNRMSCKTGAPACAIGVSNRRRRRRLLRVVVVDEVAKSQSSKWLALRVCVCLCVSERIIIITAAAAVSCMQTHARPIETKSCLAATMGEMRAYALKHAT